MSKHILLAFLLLITNISNAETTKLGAGDMLMISVYGNPDMTTETRISDTGLISFPLIGTVKVSGFDVPGAEKEIESKLEKMGFLRQPQVNIIVTQNNSNLISVLGLVAAPGKYAIEPNTKKVSDFLALAGGVTPAAAPYLTVMKNQGGTTKVINITIESLFTIEGIKNDLVLTQGDIIYVPKAPVFYIYGEVNQPGQYLLQKDMNVAQAISVGGGISLRGTEKNIEIKRQKSDSDKSLMVIDADSSALIQENDVIYVNESLF